MRPLGHRRGSGCTILTAQDASTPSTTFSSPKDAYTHSRSSFGFHIKQHQSLQTAKLAPGSGEWLLNSKDFVDWQEKEVQKLWLFGDREFWTP